MLSWNQMFVTSYDGDFLSWAFIWNSGTRSVILELPTLRIDLFHMLTRNQVLVLQQIQIQIQISADKGDEEKLNISFIVVSKGWALVILPAAAGSSELKRFWCFISDVQQSLTSVISAIQTAQLVCMLGIVCKYDNCFFTLIHRAHIQLIVSRLPDIINSFHQCVRSDCSPLCAPRCGDTVFTDWARW